jgi:hypothetical protein
MAKVVRNLIKIGKEPVVILPLEEYKKFLAWQLEREYIDKIVEEGLEEERKGKTESLENFLKREFPDLYEKYKKN